MQPPPQSSSPSACANQLVAQAVRGAVHDRAAVAAGERGPHVVDQRVVGDPEQHQVHGLGYVGQGRQAGPPEHLGPGGVDQPGALHAAAEHLGRHPPPERVRSLAGADDRDRPPPRACGAARGRRWSRHPWPIWGILVTRSGVAP